MPALVVDMPCGYPCHKDFFAMSRAHWWIGFRSIFSEIVSALARRQWHPVVDLVSKAATRSFP